MLTTMLKPYDADDMVSMLGINGKLQGVSFYVGYDAGYDKFIAMPPSADMTFVFWDLVNWLGNVGGATGLRDLMYSINRTAASIYSGHKELAAINKKSQRTEHEVAIGAHSAAQIFKSTRDLVWQLGLLCSVFYRREYLNIEEHRRKLWPEIFHLYDLFERSENGDQYAFELKSAVFSNIKNELVEPLIYELVGIQSLMSSAWSGLNPLGFGVDCPTIFMLSPTKDENYFALLRNHAIGQLMAGVDIAVKEFGLFDKSRVLV